MEDKSTVDGDAREPSFVIATFPGLSTEGFARLKVSNPKCTFEEIPQEDRCTLAVSAGIWFGLHGSGVDIKAFERNKHLEKNNNLYQFKYPISGDVGGNTKFFKVYLFICFLTQHKFLMRSAGQLESRYRWPLFGTGGTISDTWR